MNSQSPRCPKCSAINVAEILYGYHDVSEKLQQEVDAGRVISGGCVVEGPQWYCNKCEHRFRSDS